MLWLVFLAVYVGLAIAVPPRGRWWVLLAFASVAALVATGQTVAIFYGAWMLLFGALALGAYAGWSRSRGDILVVAGVCLVTILAYALVGWADWRGRPSADEIVRFAGIVAAIAGVSMFVGFGLRNARDRVAREEHSAAGVSAPRAR